MKQCKYCKGVGRFDSMTRKVLCERHRFEQKIHGGY